MHQSQIQIDALNSWKQSKHKSTLAMCTGSGKSRVGILALKEKNKINAKFALIVPTEKLRDENWKNEFIKWKSKSLFDKCDRYCYASIAKIKGNTYDCVIADEIHNLTENNKVFFDNNEVKSVIGLTATPPESIEKQEIIDEIAPVSFVYTLDQGIKDGVISNYTIEILETRLDNINKVIEAGSAGKKYMVTEKKRYEMLSSLIRSLIFSKKNSKFAIINRARFIYNLPSKTKLAKFMLDEVINPDLRCLIFCGSINQAEELCDYTYHSKSDDKDLNNFINKKINRIACVKSLNEGHNLPEIDCALIVQVNASKKDLVQRIGRTIRFRPNHTSKIWILSVIDTQDEKWVENATANFANITYKNIKEYGYKS